MLVFAYVNTSTYSLIPMYLSYSQIKRPILSHTNIFSLYQAGCTIIHEHLYTYIWTQTHSILHIYEYAHTFMHMLTPSHKDTLVHLVTLNIKQIYSHTQTDTYTIHSQTHADAQQSKLWPWSHTHIYSHCIYKGLPDSSVGKESACNAGDLSLIPGSGRSAGKGIGHPLEHSWASLVAQLVKHLPAKRKTWVRSPGWQDPLEKGKTTHSSVLAWRIPRTIQSMGLQRVGQDWSD